jgi:YD repeat-containing protein
MEFWGNMNQYALKYDADGKVVYANDEGGYFRA